MYFLGLRLELEGHKHNVDYEKIYSDFWDCFGSFDIASDWGILDSNYDNNRLDINSLEDNIPVHSKGSSCLYCIVFKNKSY